MVSPRTSQSLLANCPGICRIVPEFIGTIFIRIVAAATNNFSLAGVQLLFEGGYINFGVIPHGAIYKNSNAKGWFTRIALQYICNRDMIEK